MQVREGTLGNSRCRVKAKGAGELRYSCSRGLSQSCKELWGSDGPSDLLCIKGGRRAGVYTPSHRPVFGCELPRPRREQDLGGKKPLASAEGSSWIETWQRAVCCQHTQRPGK